MTKTLIDFSHLVMSMQDLVESIDLNPVMHPKECIIADSRIMLKRDNKHVVKKKGRIPLIRPWLKVVL